MPVYRYAFLVLCAAAALVPTSAQAGYAIAAADFKVSSSLDGRSVLPHRISWQAKTNIPASRIEEVDFLIDGKLRWVEHHAPYSYGYNANYLVTTWLKPGLHRFTVRAIAVSTNQVATTTTTARTLPATAPPATLAGTWQRTVTPNQAGAQPSGTWRLTVNDVGWRIAVPPGGANLIDVGYLPSGLLELRGGIWTRPAPSNNPVEGNGWCDEPFQPVRYHWTVSGSTLTLSLAGPKRCDGQSVIIAGTWTR